MATEYVPNIVVDMNPPPYPKITRKRHIKVDVDKRTKAAVRMQDGIPVGPYNGWHEPYHVICKRGHHGYPTPSHILHNHYGICNKCSKGIYNNASTNSKAKTYRLVREQQGIPHGPYRGNNKSFHIECMNGHHSYPKPRDIISGQGICWQCLSYNAFQNILRIIKQNNWEWGGEEWRGVHHTYLVYCENEHECYPWALSITIGYGICHSCAWSNKDVFYVVESEKGIKFGISSRNGIMRLKDHSRDGYGTIIRFFDKLPSMAASELENQCKRELPARGFQSFPGHYEYFGLEAKELLLEIVDSMEWENSANGII